LTSGAGAHERDAGSGAGALCQRSLGRLLPAPTPGSTMKVMILAAGRGERMGALSTARPKPLLEVGGKPLIAHLVARLGAFGFDEIVVNLAYRGGQIAAALGDGRRFGVDIAYSDENDSPLETGGGIRNALPTLGPDPFGVVNGDIWTDFPFSRLRDVAVDLAHLVLVDNPCHRREGDFRLDAGRVTGSGEPRLTFSGIGVYRPDLFDGVTEDRFPLAPLLVRAMRGGRVSGEYYGGEWRDVGTPERLRALRRRWERREGDRL